MTMKESTRNEIIRLYYGGTSMRKIADALHVSRHTVKRVLTEHDGGRSGESPSSRRKRPSQLDTYEATIRALLERYPEITAMRVLEELRKEGFPGGYTIVKERVGRLRPRRRKQPVMRFETSPGAQAQMDYATCTIDFTEEGPRRVHLFSYILGYSRRQYIRFVERQDFATTIRQHVRAFEHLGGVAATCLYDNMKVVVTEYDGEEAIYNTRFLAFATHYGFRPWACRPRRPQTKGKVERPFHFVETSLLNGRTFRSLDHLSEVAAWWLAGTDRRLVDGRRPHPSRNETNAACPPQGGTASPGSAAAEPLRHGGGRLSNGQLRRPDRVPGKPLHGSLAQYRPDAADPNHRKRVDCARSSPG